MSRDEPSRLRLHEQLCFAAYTASRALTGRYRQGLAELGLTYSQYLVMLVLWEHQPGPVTMGFLGRELHLDSGTLSPLVRRLERAGLVTRRRRATDERAVEISPTPAGNELEHHAQQVQKAVGRDTGLGSNELARLRDQLRALSSTLAVEADDDERAS